MCKDSKKFDIKKCANELPALKELIDDGTLEVSLLKDVANYFITLKNNKTLQWWADFNSLLEPILYYNSFEKVKGLVNVILSHDHMFTGLAPVMYKFTLNELMQELSTEIESKEFKRLFNYAISHSNNDDVKKLLSMGLIQASQIEIQSFDKDSFPFISEKIVTPTEQPSVNIH